MSGQISVQIETKITSNTYRPVNNLNNDEGVLYSRFIELSQRVRIGI